MIDTMLVVVFNSDALAVDAPEITAFCREVNMSRRRRKP